MLAGWKVRSDRIHRASATRCQILRIAERIAARHGHAHKPVWPLHPRHAARHLPTTHPDRYLCACFHHDADVWRDLKRLYITRPAPRRAA